MTILTETFLPKVNKYQEFFKPEFLKPREIFNPKKFSFLLRKISTQNLELMRETKIVDNGVQMGYNNDYNT